MTIVFNQRFPDTIQHRKGGIGIFKYWQNANNKLTEMKQWLKHIDSLIQI